MMVGDENGFSKDLPSSKDETVMSDTQHHQLPLGMQWFNGWIYIPETESESGKDSSNAEHCDSQ